MIMFPPFWSFQIEVTSLPPSFAIPKHTEHMEPKFVENVASVENREQFMARERTEQDQEQERQEEQKVIFPKDPLVVPRVNMPFQPQQKHIQIHPQSISGAQQNVLFPDLPPTRPVT